MIRKLFRIVLSIVVVLSTIVIYEIHDECCDHDHFHLFETVNAYDIGGTYGTCPECGGPMTIVAVPYASCTEENQLIVQCLGTCDSNGIITERTVTAPAPGHSYEAGVRKEATCIAEGAQQYVCSVCGDSYMERLPMTAHTYAITSERAATCTANGTRTYTCSVCGNSYTDTLTATGHSYTSRVTKAATCTEAGVRTYTCSSCGNSYTESIKATGHSYTSKVTKAATCTEAGVRTYTCSSCGNSYTESIKATGHNYSSKVTKAATCTEAGVRTFTCSNCGNSYTESIKATGHNYSSKVTKAATCTETGVRTYTCGNCNHTYTESIAATGHNYVMTSETEATCEQDGQQVHTCSNCGDSYTTVLTALGHEYTYEIIDADCLHTGTKTGTCTRCGQQTEPEITEALGHSWSELVTVKKASCINEGVSEQTCQRCGEKQQLVIDATGHGFPEEWTVEKEPTYFSEGLQSKTCSFCGERVEESIPKKSPLAIIAVSAAAISAAGYGIYYWLKKSKQVIAGAVVEEAVRELIKPSFETKTIVITDENESIAEFLKKQTYLQVNVSSYDELDESVEENEPDLIIVAINDDDRLEKIRARKDDSYADYSIGLICSIEYFKENTGKLEAMKEGKEIVGYVTVSENRYDILVKLVLPVLKPDIKSDESLDNLAQIADMLGIPGVSTVINTYVAGRDIKFTLEQGELGVVDKAVIIGDIASILGFDTVESVAGLVSDVDSIATALDKETGAYEKKEGISAGQDIIDVVSDLMDK